MEDETFQRLPLGKIQFSTQKCYVGPKLLSQLQCQIGSFVKILLSDSTKCICKVFVKKELKRLFFQCDESVTVTTTTMNHQTCKSKPCMIVTVKSDFQPLHSEPATFIEVTVVLSSIDDVLKYKSEYEKENLSSYVKNILQSYGVTHSCIIWCHNRIVAKLYRIRNIIVGSLGVSDAGIVGKVTASTVVQVKTVISKDRFEQTYYFSQVQKLGGLKGPYQLLKETICYPLYYKDTLTHMGITAGSGVLLIGPLGCGKTSLVKKVTADCGALLITVSGPEICKPYPGETESALRHVFQKAEKYSQEGACVLFLDDLEVICSHRDSGQSHDARHLAQLLTLLDTLSSHQQLVVVGATGKPYELDPAVRRPGRFDMEIFINVPNLEERTEILCLFLADLPLSPQLPLQYIAERTRGYVGADLALLCQQLRYMNMKDGQDSASVTLSDFNKALSIVNPSALHSGFGVTDFTKVAWEQIGGLEDTIHHLKRTIEWPLKYPEAFTRMGLPKPKGVLLFGPPGCAKTMMVRAAASSLNTTFLTATAAEIFSPFLGDSEKAIIELFRKARLAAPTIIFLDEIDSIVGKRGKGGKQGVQELVLSTLLNEMDGVGFHIPSMGREIQRKYIENNIVIVVAATNRPDMLDDALLRPGRFDKLVYVPPPDVTSRLSILQSLTAQIPTENVNLGLIAEMTHLFSGADLECLCREAVLVAFTEDGMDAAKVKQIHFEHALSEMTPSLSQMQIQWYEDYMAQKLGLI